MKKARIKTSFYVTEDFGVGLFNTDGNAEPIGDAVMVYGRSECSVVDELGKKDGAQGVEVFAYIPSVKYGFWINEKYVDYDI